MDDPLTRHFRTMARYNAIVNERLYESCALLSDAERKKPREAFFGSIHGTLNHILVGDRIWLARFAGEDVPSTNLDAILHEDFGELKQARRREDARVEAFAAGLDAKFLTGTIRYVNNEGRTLDDPVGLLVAHFFNHQTHHRGQVHDMLSQTEVSPRSWTCTGPSAISSGGAQASRSTLMARLLRQRCGSRPRQGRGSTGSRRARPLPTH